MSGVRRGALDRSGFTAALEALLHDLPEVLCATFIDDEGETIDLATRIDPFEARVAGAAFSLPLSSARATLRRARLGGLGELRARRSGCCGQLDLLEPDPAGPQIGDGVLEGGQRRLQARWHVSVVHRDSRGFGWA